MRSVLVLHREQEGEKSQIKKIVVFVLVYAVCELQRRPHQFICSDCWLTCSLRYLDSVTNKDSTLPPIPHLHSLLSDDVEPYPAVDIFRLIGTSYEVGLASKLCGNSVLQLPLGSAAMDPTVPVPAHLVLPSQNTTE